MYQCLAWHAANDEYLASDPKLKILKYSYFVARAQITIDEQDVTPENRQSIVLNRRLLSELGSWNRAVAGPNVILLRLNISDIA